MVPIHSSLTTCVPPQAQALRNGPSHVDHKLSSGDEASPETTNREA